MQQYGAGLVDNPYTVGGYGPGADGTALNQIATLPLLTTALILLYFYYYLRLFYCAPNSAVMRGKSPSLSKSTAPPKAGWYPLKPHRQPFAGEPLRVRYLFDRADEFPVKGL